MGSPWTICSPYVKVLINGLFSYWIFFFKIQQINYNISHYFVIFFISIFFLKWITKNILFNFLLNCPFLYFHFSSYIYIFFFSNKSQKIYYLIFLLNLSFSLFQFFFIYIYIFFLITKNILFHFSLHFNQI